MAYSSSDQPLWDDEEEDEEESLFITALKYGFVLAFLIADTLVVRPVSWLGGLWSRKTRSSAPIAKGPRRRSHRATAFFGAD